MSLDEKCLSHTSRCHVIQAGLGLPSVPGSTQQGDKHFNISRICNDFTSAMCNWIMWFIAKNLYLFLWKFKIQRGSKN